MNFPESVIVLFGMVVAFILTYRFMPSLILILKQKGLFDEATGRKIHNGNVPTMGGLIISSSLIVTFSLFIGFNFEYSVFPQIIASLILMLLIGLKDDLVGTRYCHKIIIQLIAGFMVVWQGDLVISNFNGLFNIYETPLWFGWLLTMFIIVVITNAYNLIDGLDGLAGGLGIIVSAFLGLWFLSIGLYPKALMAFCVSGTLVGFLVYNWYPAKIFMGDTGSMVVGFAISILTLSFIQTSTTQDVMLMGNHTPVIAMAALAVPLYDAIRIFLFRSIIDGKPFKPCNRHTHHIILRVVGSQRIVCLYLYFVQVLILSFALIFSNVIGVSALYFAVLLLCLILMPTVGIKRKILTRLYHILVQLSLSQNGKAHLNHRNGKKNGFFVESYDSVSKKINESI
ncbi:MAG TPA: hypothetical protein DCM62_06595 [Bacteroidales bacterium]|nr:hypothetical protein [Bacteroidales bacterium]